MIRSLAPAVRRAAYLKVLHELCLRALTPFVCFGCLQVMHSYFTASIPEPGRPWELQPDGGLQVSRHQHVLRTNASASP